MKTLLISTDLSKDAKHTAEYGYNLARQIKAEIIQLESKRYMDKSNLETWIIKLANYKEMNEIVVPTAFEVLWRLKKGDFSYAKFNLKNIEYDKPGRF